MSSIKEIKVEDDIHGDSENSFINLAQSIIYGVLKDYENGFVWIQTYFTCASR